jgi:hypothetical protein
MKVKGAAFVILLGPGEREKCRLYDFLATLLFFEADYVGASTLVVVNDRNDGLDAGDVELRFGFHRVIVLQNPYAEAKSGGDLVYDRLTAGIWAAFAQVVELDEPVFALKADTDAMVCGPFSARLERYFADHPSTGMVGSLEHDPDGRRRDTEEWWGRWIRSTCGPFPHQWLRLALRQRERPEWRREWKRWRQRLAVFRRAVRCGWRCGENILGGAYAVSPHALKRLREEEALWQDALMFNGTRVSEDVALSMLILALGLPLAEYNREAEVFAVWYQKPTLPMAEIVRRGYGLVHSIKDADVAVERAMRIELADLVGIPIEFRERTQSFRTPL